MAFESLFKLAAMLALGVFVFGSARPADGAPPPQAADSGASSAGRAGRAGDVPLMPHQFHGRGRVPRRTPRADCRWLFPLYLVLIALPVPLARVPVRLVGGRRVPSDLYVLALPMAQAQSRDRVAPCSWAA